MQIAETNSHPISSVTVIRSRMEVKQLASNYHNTYFVIRHGESTANAMGLIVSHPEHALDDFGLTELGCKQVTEAVQASTLNESTLIVSSDYSRALSSALIAQELIGAKPALVDSRLRERDFGELELEHHDHYAQVWEFDLNPNSVNLYNVETVNMVLSRVLTAIEDLEERYVNQTILIVSHGDVLQILLAFHLGLEAKHHRQITPLANAEIRPL